MARFTFENPFNLIIVSQITKSMMEKTKNYSKDKNNKPKYLEIALFESFVLTW